MKKLPGLAGVLAIAFAITTAFTTSKRIILIDKYQAKIVQSGLTIYANVQQCATNPIVNLNALSPTPLGSGTALQNLVVSFFETRDEADYDLTDICIPDTGGSPLCAVEIKMQDDTNTPQPFDSYVAVTWLVQGFFDDPVY